MPSLLVVQGSLRLGSFTSIACSEFAKKAREAGYDVTVLDLRETDLPMVDGRKNEYTEVISDTKQKVLHADIIVIGMPVYCYSLSGALKNFIDHVSHELEGKSVGAIIHGGGKLSLNVAGGHLMQILTFESQCRMLSPFVLSSIEDYTEGALKSDKVRAKMDELLSAMKLTSGIPFEA